MKRLTDYYRVLGVPKGASAEEIKRKYRELAKRYHPDVTGGDQAAEKKFIEINGAYETLGDPEKRGAYDAAREKPKREFRSSGGARYTAHSFDGDELFGDLFGSFRKQSLDATMRCEIAPWDAALGARVDVRVADKTLSVKIPAGAKSGQRLRLRGQGLSDGKGMVGDLILELTIQNPATISGEMKDLYRKMRSIA